MPENVRNHRIEYYNPDEIPSLTVVRCFGFISMGESRNAFHDSLRLLVDECREIVVDLSHVDFVDSMGLGDFLFGFSKTKINGRRFVVSGITQPRVRELFALTRMETIFEIFENEAEAVNSILATMAVST